MAAESPKLGHESYWTVDLESAYGTAKAVPSNHQPITEGGDDMRRRVDTVALPILSARGLAQQVQLRDGGGGSLGMLMNYNSMSRVLTNLLWGVETDVGASIKDNYFYPARTQISATYAVKRDDALFTYPGSYINTFTLTYSAGDPLMATADIISQKETPADTAVVVSLDELGIIKPGHLTAFTNADVDLSAAIREFTLTVSRNLDDANWKLGSDNRGEPRPRGALEAELTFTAYWDTNIYDQETPAGIIDDFFDNTSRTFTITFNNGLATTLERAFTIYMPAVRVRGETPVVENQGALLATVTYAAEDATIAAAAMTGADGGANAIYYHAPIAFMLSNDENAATLAA